MVVVEKFMMLIYKLAALVQSDTTNLKSPDLGHITFDPSMIFDNQGIVISIVGYVIVFASLVFLYFVVSSLGRYFLKQQKKKLAEESGGKEYDESSFDVPGEINAAIATALYMYYNEARDIEEAILTINRVQRIYQPWNSKIYNLTKYPGKDYWK